MTDFRPEPISGHRAHLGEGPLWDPDAQCLYWVDSLGPTLFQLIYQTEEVTTWALPASTIGSVAVRASGGLVLAMDHGFYAFDPGDGALDLIAAPLTGRDKIRFNDGKVDPYGAFVAGAMNANEHDHENCGAFRLNPDLSVEPLLDGFDVFNGPCFDASGRRIYFTGREDGLIETAEYSSNGSLTGIARFFEGGIPDGATVDADDHLWTAQWTEGCLLRLTPQGEIDCRLDLPGQIVTSVMFGGPALDTLFVTTVGKPLRGVAPTGPDAGRTFALTDTGFTGRPEPAFLG